VAQHLERHQALASLKATRVDSHSRGEHEHPSAGNVRNKRDANMKSCTMQRPGASRSGGKRCCAHGVGALSVRLVGRVKIAVGACTRRERFRVGQVAGRRPAAPPRLLALVLRARRRRASAPQRVTTHLCWLITTDSGTCGDCVASHADVAMRKRGTCSSGVDNSAAPYAIERVLTLLY